MIASLFILSLGLLACDDAEEVNNDNNNVNNEQENTNSSNDVNGNEKEIDEDLLVGDTVNFDGLKITLNEVRDEPGGDFDEPNEDLFIVANLTIVNTTDEEHPISSLMSVDLKDEEGYSYNATFLVEGTQGQLDGAVEPGETMRGEVAFDTSESGSYELYYSDALKSGKAKWKFSFDELE